jgi:hypothetical protein
MLWWSAETAGVDYTLAAVVRPATEMHQFWIRKEKLPHALCRSEGGNIVIFLFVSFWDLHHITYAVGSAVSLF